MVNEAATSGDVSAEIRGKFASIDFISHDNIPKLNALKLFGMTDWEWRGERGAQLKTMQPSFRMSPA